MSKSSPITLAEEFSKLKFLENRTPELFADEGGDGFSTLSNYRDGAVFIGHYAGNSEWERHADDEIVQIIDGAATIILYEHHNERRCPLQAGQIIIVPKGIWHRFESTGGVKVMSVTPQPTEQRVDLPVSA